MQSIFSILHFNSSKFQLIPNFEWPNFCSFILELEIENPYPVLANRKSKFPFRLDYQNSSYNDVHMACKIKKVCNLCCPLIITHPGPLKATKFKNFFLSLLVALSTLNISVHIIHDDLDYAELTKIEQNLIAYNVHAL